MYSVYSMYSTGTYIAKITTISYCKVHVHKIMWGNNYMYKMQSNWCNVQKRWISINNNIVTLSIIQQIWSENFNMHINDIISYSTCTVETYLATHTVYRHRMLQLHLDDKYNCTRLFALFGALKCTANKS